MQLNEARWKLLGKPRTKVLVNGYIVEGCIEADDEKGYAVCAVRGEGGSIIVDEMGRTRFTTVRGKVFIAIERKHGTVQEILDADAFRRYMEEFAEPAHG